MTIGTYLRRFRENIKLSQQQVADELGVSQATYNLWESDKSSFKIDFLFKLAKIYNVEPGEIIIGVFKKECLNNRPKYAIDDNGCPICIITNNLYKETIKSKNETIKAQEALVHSMQIQINFLKEEIEGLKKQKFYTKPQ